MINTSGFARAFSAAFLGAVLVATMVLPAAALQPDLIAVIDMERIVRDSAAGKSIRTQLESQMNALQTEIQNKQSSIENDVKKLNEQRVVLGQEAFEQRMGQLQQDAVSAERDLGGKEQRLRAGAAVAQKELFDAVKPIIEEQTKAAGATMLIQKTAVLVLTQADADITQRVISALDAKVKSIRVTPVDPATLSGGAGQ